MSCLFVTLLHVGFQSNKSDTLLQDDLFAEEKPEESNKMEQSKEGLYVCSVFYFKGIHYSQASYTGILCTCHTAFLSLG